MRVQIQIPPELWGRLCALAHEEHRPPRQQVEFILYRALENGAHKTPVENGQEAGDAQG